MIKAYSSLLTSLFMGKRGKKKDKQAWLDNMTSNTSDMVDQFEDSASASGFNELKFRRDTQITII